MTEIKMSAPGNPVVANPARNFPRPGAFHSVVGNLFAAFMQGDAPRSAESDYQSTHLLSQGKDLPLILRADAFSNGILGSHGKHVT
jgi:hypothetical protein